MPETRRTERLGIAAVQSRAADLGLIWRETPTGDVGIDGHLEFIRDDGTTTGMIVGVQVKSGRSYLKRQERAGYRYTACSRHQHYWETYPVPVLLVLHDPEAKQSYWIDIRQEFRSRKTGNGTVLVPKSRIFQHATADELFANAGLNSSEYIADSARILELMLVSQTENPNFNVSFFDLFCLGMTNVARSLYFGMDLVMMIVQHKNAHDGSLYTLGPKEYAFLEKYIRFLVSQNLVHANYSDIRIDLDTHHLIPVFVAPLSLRGQELVAAIDSIETLLTADGSLTSTEIRAVQEAFVEISERSMLSRFRHVDQVRKAILTKKRI